VALRATGVCTSCFVSRRLVPLLTGEPSFARRAPALAEMGPREGFGKRARRRDNDVCARVGLRGKAEGVLVGDNPRATGRAVTQPAERDVARMPTDRTWRRRARAWSRRGPPPTYRQRSQRWEL
jgi:hypothetical protein